MRSSDALQERECLPTHRIVARREGNICVYVCLDCAHILGAARSDEFVSLLDEVHTCDEKSTPETRPALDHPEPIYPTGVVRVRIQDQAPRNRG